MRSLSALELQTELSEGIPPLLLDVREPWEFQLARINGSINVPMASIPAAATEGALGTSEAAIVVICHHGMRSQQVAEYLERLGFGSVANLVGGIDGWARLVDPRVPTY
jgi:rhodanese-related sulfurtransferase